MDKSEQPEKLLSIVVPVYNAETYIKQCLDSLLEQDTEQEKYEIICINDGSTDDSLRILEEYAKKYDNIRLIDKQNEGVSVARNLGLEKACGKYVWFVDADDWIARNCFGVIFNGIEKYHPSVAQIHFNWIKAAWRVKECRRVILNKDNVSCSIHGLSFLPFDGAWSVIVRKEILDRYQHRFFRDLHYGEDILFVRELFDRMRMEVENDDAVHKVLHCTGEIFYYYRQHEQSAMSVSWTKNRKRYMDALLKMAQINKERMEDESKPKWYNDEYRERFYHRMFNYMMNWLPGSGLDVKKTIKELREKKIWPCKIRAKISKEKPQGLKEKLVSFYREIAFENCWLYIRYHRQMEKKYKKSDAYSKQ